MFESREQRILVIRTLLGAIGGSAWLDDSGWVGRGLVEYGNVRAGRPVDLSGSAEWIFRLAVSMWEGHTLMRFGEFYRLDGRNRKIVFGFLACLADYENQHKLVDVWAREWAHLRSE